MASHDEGIAEIEKLLADLKARKVLVLGVIKLTEEGNLTTIAIVDGAVPLAAIKDCTDELFKDFSSMPRLKLPTSGSN